MIVNEVNLTSKETYSLVMRETERGIELFSIENQGGRLNKTQKTLLSIYLLLL